MEKRVQFQKKRNRVGITNASKTKYHDKGKWTLNKNKWLGEKEIELDEFDIITSKSKSHVDINFKSACLMFIDQFTAL